MSKIKINKIKLLADKVLIKPSEVSNKTSGGIILSNPVKDNLFKGEVVAVGPKSTLKIGDLVLYDKFIETTVLIDSVEYPLMKEGNVYLVL